MNKVNVKSRFDKYHMPVTETGCWLWTGGEGRKGYGSFRGGHGKTTSAHRQSWILYKGDIPKGLFVLHKCDTPPCVNPEHLYLGTAADNTRDMMKRGRHIALSGEDTPAAKLTEDQVRYIRSLDKPLPARKLSQKLGITTETLYQIYNRKIWRHVA